MINCQSIRNKKSELRECAEYIKPDIIIACESWLSSEHKNAEIFADGLKDESIEGIDDRALSFCMTLNRFEILNSYESYVKLSTFWVLHLQHIHDTSDRWSKFILASVISRQLEWYQILHSSQHIAL
jgi:hypothetical protein